MMTELGPNPASATTESCVTEVGTEVSCCADRTVG